uniref:Uncharacterized protein n=1 Tax=Triticum urartu TaxID=4572 RepID=A0A8R7TLF0_TRIUA
MQRACQMHQSDISAQHRLLRRTQLKKMGLRGMACWHHSQLDGRAMMCIRWLLRDLRLRLSNSALYCICLLCYFACNVTFDFGNGSLRCSLLYAMVVSYVSMFALYNVNLNMQGSYVYDINGNKYLDSLAGLW